MDQMLLAFLLRVGVDLAGSSGCGASKERSSVWYVFDYRTCHLTFSWLKDSFLSFYNFSASLPKSF